jgi:hypothetical protein
MTDVRMPDGTIIKNVPDGITQAELLGRYQAAAGPSMGPAEMSGPQITQASYAESYALEAAENSKIPLLQSERFHEKSIPVLGGLSALLAPGAGVGALGVQGLLATLGGGAGELVRQNQARETIDPQKAFKVGAIEGAGTVVGGGIAKGLGAVAKKIFSSPLSDPQKAAAEFARTKGAPYPLASAAVGSGAARTQQATRGLLPGELRTQQDANKVTHFLNRELTSITEKSKPIDDAAQQGQKYLRSVFEPGETVYTQTFQRMRRELGDESAVQLGNMGQVVDDAIAALAKRGETKGVYNRLIKIAKSNPLSVHSRPVKGATVAGPMPEMTVAQLDELYSGLLKDIRGNANATREANAVMAAIIRDIDAMAGTGTRYADEISKAKAARDELRELRNIPGLDRLAKDFGPGGTAGSRQWMSELFANPNGKALAELRTRNPVLYHDLADSWLAHNLNRFAKPNPSGLGRVLDGTALRAWFEQNQNSIKLIYGAPQAQALDNFSNYASQMTGAVGRATNPNRFASDPMAMITRGTAEAAGVATMPFLFVPGEAASFVLAKGLSDPSSTLFRLFTEGFSPATRAFMRRAGQFSGQAVADGQGER